MENHQPPLNLELSDSAAYQALFDRLAQPLLFLKDAGVASKNFIDWRKAGLWFDDINEKRTWTKLSLEQYTWLKIIQQLRQFGCTTELILKVKQQLLEVPDLEAMYLQYQDKLYAYLDKLELGPDEKAKLREDYKSGALMKALKESEEGKKLSAGQSILRGLLLAALVKHQHAAVLVFPDGNITTWLDEIHLIDPETQKLFKRTHIYISISEHLLGFLTDPDKEAFIQPLQLLTSEEWQVMRALRDNTLKSITIHSQKDPKTKKVTKTMFTTKDGEMRADDKEAIMEIMLNKKYSGFEFKRRSGDRFYFEKDSSPREL